MRPIRTTAAALAVSALALGMATTQAEALSVKPGDPGFIVSFNDNDTLLAELTWTLVEKAGDLWTFAVEVVNNSSGSPDRNRITGIAFGSNPAPTGLTITDDDNGTWNVARTGNIGGAGFQAFELNACVGSGKTNCVGGGGGGVDGGNSSTMELQFSAAADSLLFGDFATRWQSLEGGESKVIGSISVAPIPLPAGGWLLLLGLGGLGLFGWRRHERAAA